MTGWDLALLVVAGYLAVMALIRLTLRRRQQMYDEIRRQIEDKHQQAKPQQQSQQKASQAATHAP